MHLMIPTDSLTGALELLCYLFTIVGAVASYLLALR